MQFVQRDAFIFILSHPIKSPTFDVFNSQRPLPGTQLRKGDVEEPVENKSFINVFKTYSFVKFALSESR